MPKIIKNWGIERKELKDPLTGRRMWQLTNNPAMSSHFYFTRTSWIYDRYLCFVSDRSGASNLFMFDPDDWSILQLTDFPPYHGDKFWITYDKKRMQAEHNLGSGHIVMTATADPQGHGLYFDSGALEQNLLRYDFDTGQVATVMEKAAGCICGNGCYSLHTEFEDNYTTRIRHSRLFKIDLKTGTRELVLEEDGDFAHMFCCPADPNLVIWINYHQGQGRALNLATGGLGVWCRFKHPGNTYYHYSFLPNSSLILTAHVEPRSQTPPAADVVWTIQKPDGTLVDTLESFTPINHATASHDHRRVIGDTRCDSQKKSALHLWDRDTRRTEPFCQCNANFNGRDKDGNYYDEWFHPNPLSSCHLWSRLWHDKSCRWRDKSIGRLFVTLICLLGLGVLALRAANYYVATNGSDNPTCTDWTTPASNIQYAVDLAIGADDTVWVSNGSYRVTNQITITNKITVRSLNGWTNTIVYTEWPYWTTRCFYVSRTGTLDGFMITNGHYWASNNYDGGGGAFLSNGTIQNCYFRNNICSNDGTTVGGGGLYIKNGTVSNCTFLANSSRTCVDPWGGGGIMISAKTYANVFDCLIISNTLSYAGRGAGIHIDNAQECSPFISNCNFNGNSGGEYVGIYLTKGYMVDCGISNHSGSQAMACWGSMRNCVVANNSAGGINFTYGGSATNCIISGNSRSDTGAGVSIGPDGGRIDVLEQCIISNNICTAGDGGGGVRISKGNSGFTILRNCLIHNNTNMSATGYGGGVYLTNAAISRTSMVINCTIVNNYSTNEGGGLAASGISNYIVNCIIADNNSFSGNYPNVYHVDTVDSNKSNFYYSCVVTTDAYLLATGQGNITNDPAFIGASADNWRLAANSPCINNGTNQSWMTNAYDLDGRKRIRYGTVDIGAYERIHDGTIYGF